MQPLTFFLKQFSNFSLIIIIQKGHFIQYNFGVLSLKTTKNRNNALLLRLYDSPPLMQLIMHKFIFLEFYLRYSIIHFVCPSVSQSVLMLWLLFKRDNDLKKKIFEINEHPVYNLLYPSVCMSFCKLRKL